MNKKYPIAPWIYLITIHGVYVLKSALADSSPRNSRGKRRNRRTNRT